MRVLVLNDHGFVSGGASAVALASTRGLAARGIPTTCFTSVQPLESSLAEAENLRLVSLGGREIAEDSNRVRAFVGGLWNHHAWRVLNRELATHSPVDTIIHVHMWTKALSHSVLHLAIKRGYKVLLTLHDFFIGCPTGGLYLPQTGEICPHVPMSWGCLKCSCDRRQYAHKLWRSARTFLQNRVLRIPHGVTHFVAVSEMSAALMRPWLPPTSRIAVVRNPIETVDLGPAPVDDSAPFVYVGRFSPEKGVLLAAQAVQRMGVPAVFIGDGELAPKVRELCPDAVFTGWLSSGEIRKWLHRARALLFPPLWYETLGLVVIEAAAAGIPAIIADRCAATDFIVDGETGLFFTHGSLDGLCAQMARLNEPGTAARLGHNAYRWYWDNPWDIDNHVQELLSLYESVLRE